jgi:hypothetical protein
MSNLSQFLGGSSGSSGGGGGGNANFSTDPFERAAWYVHTAVDTSSRGYIVYNHYNRPITTWSNLSGPNLDSSYGPETTNNHSGVMTTNSHSSSSTRSHGSNAVSGGSGDIGGVAPNAWGGHMQGHAMDHYRHTMSANMNSCCWVGNTDPQRRIFRRGQECWAGGRSAMEGSSYNTHGNVWTARGYAKQMRQNWYFGSSVSTTNRFGWAGSSNDSRGCMGYNQRTKVMVFVESTSTSNQRWHWYKDVPPPHPGVDWNWWRQNVKESNHRWTDVPYSIYDNEDRYHHTVIPCDNGQVYCTYMRPHTGFYIQAINFTNETYGTDTDCGYTFRKELDQYGVENTTDVNSIKGSMTTTTTYGISSDEDHGQMFMITNDGRYVLCMTPYYYYGSGIKMYMIDSVTGEYRKGWNNDTSYSMCVSPVGANDFVFNRNVNSDSDYRLYSGRHSMEENFHSYKIDNYGQGGNNIAWGPADGGTINSNFTNAYGMFDSCHHSTNYPRIYPVIPGALTIAEVEAYRGPATNDWSTPQNAGFTYSDQATWKDVNPPESGW